MDIDLKTQGIIDITLKPGEVFLGERGSMAFCDGGISKTPIKRGFVKSIRRMFGGESFWSLVEFKNSSSQNQKLKLRYDIQSNAWFWHNQTNTDLYYIDLSKFESALIVPKGAFFAATGGVDVDVFFDSTFGRSFFGFGNLFYQKLSGNGTVFLQKDRWLLLNELSVERNTTITIDPQEVYGYPLKSLIDKDGFSIKSFLSGEGFSSFEFQGPAKILTYKVNSSTNNIRKGSCGGCLLKILLAVIFFFYLLPLLFNMIF